MPIQITTSQQFDEIVKESNLIIIHFSANWAEQCSQINDVLDELAKQGDYSKRSVKFCVCEAEDLADKSLQYKIEAAPTILFFRNEKVIDRIDGADVNLLTAKVHQHNSSVDATPVPKNNLEDRLKQLINRHNIIIFMKGNKENPRCGFSKQLIAIISNIGVEYDTFDILQDEEVRQGLKVYSDWPTYPQLYVKGELLGGLDIVKEMLAEGDLEQTLKG